METVEKRSIPRDQLTEGQQAERTFSLRFKEVDPGDKVIDGLAGTEGYKLRVRALFDAKKGQESRLGKPVVERFRGLKAPEVLVRESSLDAQARSYLEQMVVGNTHGWGLAHVVLFGNEDLGVKGMGLDEECSTLIRPPTPEETMQILEKLTPAEVEDLKRFMKEPEISLEPQGIGWRRYVFGIDADVQNLHKTSVGDRLGLEEGKRDNIVLELDRQDELLGINGEVGDVTGWDLSVCDGSREGPDNNFGYLRDVLDRDWERGEAKARGLQLHDFKSYALAQMRVRASGRPTVQGRGLLDSDGFTVLQRADNGEVVCPGGKMVIGGCDGWKVLGLHRVDFSPYDLQKGHYSDTRFRLRMVIRNVK